MIREVNSISASVQAKLLRFLEERSYVDLADRLGVSEATARKRVSRGLAELRRRLARPSSEGPGFHALCLAALGLEAPAEPLLGPALTLGALTMGPKSLVVVLGTLLVLGLGTWSLQRGGAPAPSPEPEPAVTTVRDPAAPTAAGPEETPAGRGRVVAPATAVSPSPAAAATPAPAPDPVRELHGRVLEVRLDNRA